MRERQRRNGFTIIDLAAAVAVSVITLAIVLPAAARLTSLSQSEQSMVNLSSLWISHILYASDWNGRQFTNVVDELSQFGDSPGSAVSAYNSQFGTHPPILLGWGTAPGEAEYAMWGYYMSFVGNHQLLMPTSFVDDSPFGVFRIMNAKPFHDYVNGRFYDDSFYAPGDTAAISVVEPLFDHPDEFVVVGGQTIYWSSYCFSPASMYHPDVMRANVDGGWQDPWLFDDAFESPSFFAAEYPDLKTHIIEHNWVQSPPATCNPAFGDAGTYDGCEPYYFSHGIDAMPATVFYDGSTRLLPNEEAFMADAKILAQTGGVDGLWHRGTGMGPSGYLTNLGFDGTPLGHHVLTTDGIMGRDTLAGMGISQRPPREQPVAAHPGPVTSFGDGGVK